MPAALFDYSTVDPSFAAFLRDAARSAFDARPSSAPHAVAIGRTLVEVKSRLPFGQWQAWCRTESSWGQTAIELLVRVAKKFSHLKIREIHGFGKTALYMLSRPSVAESARLTAIAEARAGKYVSRARALELIGVFESSRPPSSEIASPTSASSITPWSAESSTALVTSLLARGTLYLHWVHDENGGNLVCGSTMSPDGRRAEACRESVDLVLLALAGREPMKKCNGACGLVKGIGEFALHAMRKDGRSDSCRMCERARMARVAQRKKAAKKRR